MADHEDGGLVGPERRDLRLDLVRGIGQWMVFLDHVPYDVVSWLTLRNYGFSDAAEFFVFISGYTAGFVYAPAMRHGQFLAVAKRLFKRVWQLYIAHIFLFLVFIAQIARADLAGEPVEIHGGRHGLIGLPGELRQESGDHPREDIAAAARAQGRRARRVDPHPAVGECH